MKWIFNCVPLIFLCLNLHAQEVKPANVTEAKSDQTAKPDAAQSSGKSLLWEITGKELPEPSYLYGTIHMIEKKDFFLTDATKAAFAECDRVTFEINMEEMNDMTALFSLLGSIMMEGEKNLKDLISEEDYALVKKHFDEMGMPLMLFEKMKPMFLTTFADADLAKGSMGGGDVVSYEMEFMEMAKSDSKEVGGLETIEFQMSIFDSIPYKAQAQMLVDGIKAEKDTTVQGEGEFDQMVQMYKDQNIEAMVSMFDSGEGGIGQYEQILLINRNTNWIPIMAKMMKEKRTFFAVGAGHLGGKQGVIQLLKQEGYNLKPLF